MFTCLHVYMFTCLHVYMFIFATNLDHSFHLNHPSFR